MAETGKPSKPSWTERWLDKSAVERRLSVSATKSRLKLAVLFFLLAPFAGFGLIAIGMENYLWVPGALLLALGVLAWIVTPFLIGGGIVYSVFRSLRSDMTLTLAKGGTATPRVDTNFGNGTDEILAPALTLLSQLQRDIAAQRRAALARGLPVAGLISLGLCIWIIKGGGGFNPIPLAIAAGFPLLFGLYLISSPFQSRFRLAFKDEVVPILLERHGALQRNSDYHITFPEAARAGVVLDHTEALVDDAFIGRHRDHAVEIADVVLLGPERSRRENGRPTRAQQRLLAITLHLPQSVPVPTAVLDSKRDKTRCLSPAAPMQRLALEDVVFSAVYDVYSTDQVGGRALLTPAVMRRLLEVADGREFLPPTLHAEGGDLQLFLTTYDERDLFEPGSVAVADMASHVRGVDRDLGYVFAIVETLIDMAEGLNTPRLAASPPQ